MELGLRLDLRYQVLAHLQDIESLFLPGVLRSLARLGALLLNLALESLADLVLVPKLVLLLGLPWGGDRGVVAEGFRGDFWRAVFGRPLADPGVVLPEEGVGELENLRALGVADGAVGAYLFALLLRAEDGVLTDSQQDDPAELREFDSHAQVLLVPAVAARLLEEETGRVVLARGERVLEAWVTGFLHQAGDFDLAAH